MATTANPTQNTQDPFKQKYKTPRDLLLDPGFHSLTDLDVKRSLLSEVYPGFNDYDEDTQNKDLGKSLKDWQDYYSAKDEAAKPKPPSFWEQTKSAVGGLKSLPPPPGPVEFKPKDTSKIPGSVKGMEQAKPGEIKAITDKIAGYQKELEGIKADISGRWPKGPNKQDKNDVDAYNERASAYNEVLKKAGPEAQRLGKLYEVTPEPSSQAALLAPPEEKKEKTGFLQYFKDMFDPSKGTAKFVPMIPGTMIPVTQAAPNYPADIPIGVANKIPFAGGAAEATHYIKILNSARHVRDGSASEADYNLLRKFSDEIKRDANKEKTFGYRVAEIVGQLPTFAVEFAATGGTYTGVRKLILEAAGEAAAKKAVTKLALKGAAAGAGALAQTLANPQMIMSTAAQKSVEKNVTPRLEQVQGGENWREELAKSFKDMKDDFAKQVAQAVPSTFVEIASERTGETLLKPIEKVLSKIPLPKRVASLKQAIANRWMALTGGQGSELVRKIKQGTHWDGIVGEILEERAADVMHYANQGMGLEQEEKDSPALVNFVMGKGSRMDALKELWGQLGIEAAAFSIPGAAYGVADYASTKANRHVMGKRLEQALNQKGVTPDSIEAIGTIIDLAPEDILAPEDKAKIKKILDKKAKTLKPKAEKPLAPPPAEAPIPEQAPPIPEQAPEIPEPPAPIPEQGATETIPPVTETKPPVSETTPAPTETIAPPTETLEAPPAEAPVPTPEPVVPPPAPAVEEPPAPVEDTVPEKPATVLSQIETLGKGERKVVFVPGETLDSWSKQDILNDFLKSATQDPRIMSVDIEGKGTYFFDPSMITADDIQLAVDAGTDHELMGILDPKSTATSIGIYVQKWNPETNSWDEFMSMLTTPEHLRAQVQRLRQETEGQGKFRFITGPSESIAQETVEKRLEVEPAPAEELPPPPEEVPSPIQEPEKPAEKQLVPPPATELETRRPTLQIKDGKIKTLSGREIPAPPPIRLDSDRKAANDVKKVDAWLLDQAQQEAEDRDDDFNKTQFSGLKPDKLSPADKDILNQYLFGHEDPEILAEEKPDEQPTQEVPPKPPESKIEEEPPAPSIVDEIKEKIRADFPDWSPETVDAEAEKATKGYGPWAPGRDPKLAEIEKKAMGWAPTGKAEAIEPPPEGSGNILEAPPEEAKPAEPAQPEEIGRDAQFKQLIDRVKTSLANGEKFNNPKLQAMANDIFGGARGEGKYTLRDMYDAFEGGVSAYVEESGIVDFKDPAGTLQKLEELQNRLAVQSDRTTEQIDLQQFSTPPLQAFVTAYALGEASSPLFGLEPSAGTGMLATMMRIRGMQVRANEIDPRRVAILKLRGFATSEVDALHLTTTGHDLSDYDPDVVLMNPPFSAGPGKMHGMEFGARHVLNALQKLNPGGRLVAIVGDGMGHGRQKFNKWWGNIQSQYTVRADIGLDGKYYAKMGTTYDNRVIVIDKTGPTPGGTPAKQSENILIREKLSPAEAAAALRVIAAEDIHERLTRPVPGKSLAPPPEDTGASAGPAEPTDGIDSGQPGVSGGRPGVPSGIEPGPTELRPVSESTSGGSGRPSAGNLPANVSGEQASTGEPGRTPELGGGSGTSVSGIQESSVPVEIALEEQKKELGEEETDSYVKYQVRKARYKGAVSHPADLIESATLGSVESPDVHTKVNVPKDVISEGRLSDAQLETITYAIQRFSAKLPDGKTPGYWVGDGTGVGKGREIAGIIYHFLRESGQKKALWISATQQLYEDSKRDIAGVGVPLQVIHQNDSKYAKGAPIESNEGILFTQYGTAAQDWGGKRDRFNQIVNWLQPTEMVDGVPVASGDFEGVIVFDECHLLKNAVGTNQGGASTKATGTQRGEMGLLLAETFPKAKIVYVSATGATLAHNMGYMNRLGLWGKGAPFTDFDAFMAAMNAGGLGAMEMLARDLKSVGAFMSRQISFRGVDYDYVNHDLNEYQLEQYNKSASLWSKLSVKMDDAAKNANQKKSGNRYSAFYSTQQRFFLMLMTTYQMHSVLQHMDASLKNGMAPIVNLLSTNETLMKKQVAKAEAAGKSLEDLDLGPRQMLRGFIEQHFPLVEFEDVPDPDNPGKTMNVSTGEINQENLRMQQELLDELEYLNLPDNPIDMIAHHLGGWHKVAEVSGRTERMESGKLVRRKPPGKKTGETINNAELRRFQNGEAQVLIITGAGSAGISAQAERGIPTQNKRRIMYCAQLSWSADQQMQFFGRAHRSNQVTPPVIMLVRTNVKGQQRLINAVSRRLASLGAVTQGNRESLGGNLFDIEDLTDGYGRAALMGLVNDLANNSYGTQTLSGQQILQTMGWLTPNGSVKPGVDTNVEGFLNRIMVLPVEDQNKIFDNFYDRYRSGVMVAKDQGTFDTGISKIRGSNIGVTKSDTIYKDQFTNATTKFLEMEGDFKVDKLKFEDVPRGADFLGFVTNKRSGKIYAVHNWVDPQTGHRLADIRGTRYTRQKIEIHDLNENYQVIKETPVVTVTQRDKFPEPPKSALEQAKDIWDNEYSEIPETTRKPIYMITGAIIPIYDKIIGNKELHNLKVVRAVLKDGSPVIGIQVRPNEIGPLKMRLGMGNDFAQQTGSAIFHMVREGATIELDNGWRIRMSAPIHGERRMEIDLRMSYKESAVKNLKEMGAFSEIIVGGESRRPRVFVPLDETKGPQLLDKIFERNKPVQTISTGETKSTGGGFDPTSSASMGMTIDAHGTRNIEIGRGETPETEEQAKAAARFWLKQAQDSIDNILNDRGTIDDQMFVHQNPVIAKHIMNWINGKDDARWLNERIYVDSVIDEVADYNRESSEYDPALAKAEALHYFPYVESMMSDLDSLDRGIPTEPGPEEINEEVVGLASPPTSPILPPPPAVGAGSGYSAPPKINHDDLVSRNQILKNLAKKLRVPIRYGRFRIRAEGIFKVNPEVVRMKRAQDVAVAAHEVGHAINKMLWGKSGGQLNWRPLVPYRQELEAIATKPRAGQSKLPEGFAEYIRYWITEPARAAQVAPGTHMFFEGLLAKNEDLRSILDEARRDYQRWINQTNSAKILSHISVDEQDYKQMGWWDRLYTGIVDRLNPIKVIVDEIMSRTGKKIPPDANPYELAQNLAGWAGKAEHFLEVGTFEKDLRNIIGPGLKEILEPMKDRLDDLRITAIALRVLEKKGLQGIDVGITVKEAQDTLREQGFDPSSFYGTLAPAQPGMPSLVAYNPNALQAMTPEAQQTKDTLLQLYRYQDDLLRYFKSSGMLSDDQYAKIKMLNQFFVPFHRMYEAGAGEKATESKAKHGSSVVNLWQPVQRMKGSWRPIIDPLESVIKNTYTLINIAERNMVAQSIADLAKIEGVGHWIEGPLPANMIPQTFALDRIKQALDRAGVDLQDPNLNLDQLATIFVPKAAPSAKENIVTVFRNGKPELYQLEPNLYRAVVGLDRNAVSPFLKIAALPASFLRMGATGINPEFAARNPLRDTLTGWLQTEVGFIPGYHSLIGLAHVLMKDDVYREWQRSGGPFAALSSIDRRDMREKIDDLMRNKMSYAVHHPIQALRILSETSEAMTRVAIYELARKKGQTIRQAGHASRESNLNFQRMGVWTAGFNMVIPFLNASIQDVDKFVRVHKSNPKRAVLKGLVVSLISLLVYYLNKDDERFKELPAWQRDLFWNFPTKGIPGLEKATPFIPIPKPFIWGYIYGNPVERLAEWIDSKDPTAFDGYLQNLFTNLMPSLWPTALKTPLELADNKNRFTGRPIESKFQEEHYAPEYRSNWYTSYWAKQTALGLAKMGVHVSPLKIEHAMFSSFGGTARIMMKLVLDPATKLIVPPTGAEMPDSSMVDIPLLRSFAVRYPHASLKSITMVEDAWDKINKRYQGFTQDQKEFRRNNIPPLTPQEQKEYGALKYTTDQISAMNREIHRIIVRKTDDKGNVLTGEEKRKRIDKLYLDMLKESRKVLIKLGKRHYKNETPRELLALPTEPTMGLMPPPEE